MASPFPTAIVCLLVVAVVSRETRAADWSYTGANPPQNWSKLYPVMCNGVRQSPINIDTSSTKYDPNLVPISISRNQTGPFSQYNMTNNGHSIVVSFPDKEWLVTMSSSKNQFTAVQIHWHWGSQNNQGSEHTVDSRSWPMEGHIVTYNSDMYSSFTDAVKVPQGLAVLGIFYTAITSSAELNAVMETIISVGLDSSAELAPGHTTSNPLQIPGFNVDGLLPTNRNDYYRYDGSLTTPPCTENVLWTVFRTPCLITPNTLAKFRAVAAPETEQGKNLVNNYRPTLPLNPNHAARSFRVVIQSFSNSMISSAPRLIILNLQVFVVVLWNAADSGQ